MTDTPNYDINYEDERFTEAENWRTDALDANTELYDGAIADVEAVKQDQIDAANSYAAQQSKNAQERTDFTIEQINQQKDQAKKDYTKEQSASYVDWQKQSDAYGANAEAAASKGMAGTGYSESSQVSMYNQYQNRVAVARESYQRAVLNYDNAIKDAQLQNNALLAEIAYQALQTSLEATISAMQQKNTLIMAKASEASKIESMYDTKYQNVLAQMNTENSLAETVRQANLDDAYRNAALAEEKRQFDILHSPKVTQIIKGGATGTKQTNVQKMKDDVKATVKDHEDSSTEVDMNSLTKIGLSGRSAAYVNKLVQEGRLKEVYNSSTGKLEFAWANPLGGGSLNITGKGNKVFQKR